MGTITRHAGAPFADGEILPGADLEADFDTIYDLVNGGIDDANLEDLGVTTSKLAASAVTTAKLAANAVTQAKMTSGAASASEVTAHWGTTNYAFSTSAYSDVGPAISHTVGNPARHVIIMASWLHVYGATGAPTGSTIRLMKGGVDMRTAGFIHEIQNPAGSTNNVNQMETVIFIDDAPTPGGTHTYQLQMQAIGNNCGAYHLMMFAFEPRS